MTFEQKVDKLRGIVDKKILVYCKTEEEDKEFCKIANYINSDEDDKYDSYISNCYYFVSMQNNKISVVYEGRRMVEYKGGRYEDYNVIPYSEFFADDKVEDKPLEEWTLREVKEYCKEQDTTSCKSCKFYNFCEVRVDNWEFPQPTPSLTQSEIDILKAIKVLYPLNNNLTLKYVAEPCGFSVYPFNIFIQLDRLPSLSHDATYSISELLEGVD